MDYSRRDLGFLLPALMAAQAAAQGKDDVLRWTLKFRLTLLGGR